MWSVSYEEDEDTFGPGTDLVISVFAVLMVLVALGIHHYRNQTTTLDDEYRQLVIRIGELERQNADLKRELNPDLDRAMDLQTQLKQAQDSLQRLEQDIRALQQRLTKEQKKSDQYLRELQFAQTKVDRLQLERKNLTEQLAQIRERDRRLVARFETVEQNNRELAEKYLALKKKNKLLYTVQEGKGYKNFAQGEAELTSEAKWGIQRKLDEILAAFGQANQIDVVGYASAEPYISTEHRASTDVSDNNLNLSASRAIIVAHFLASQGIPYSCISARGVGRSRSGVLKHWLEQGKLLKEWDALWSDKYSKVAMEKQYKDSLEEERRIEIRAVYEEESTCTFDSDDARRLMRDH